MIQKWGKFLVVLGLVLAAPRALLAADLFAVDVMVDVSDVNAAKAREKAMTAANRQAFISVLKKLTSPDAVRQLQQLNDNQILNFIKEVSVVSEKASNVRYIAELKVKFNEEILKKYLNEKNIPFTEEAGFRVVVVPIFHEFPSDPPQLWEASNLWRQAWEKKQGSGSGIVDFISAEATGANYEMLSAAKALEMDAPTLDWLGRTYKADEVYVLDAVYDGIDGLKVKMYAVSGRGGVERTIRVPGNKGEKLFADAVDQAKSVIGEQIKNSNLAESQQKSQIMVLFEFNKISQWLQLQKELKQTPYIKEIREDAIGLGKVQFQMLFTGSPQRLEQMLAGRQIFLHQYDGFYTITKK